MTEVRHWTEVADDPRLVSVGGREELMEEGRCEAASFGRGAYALDFLINYDGQTPEGTRIWRDRGSNGRVTGMLWKRCLGRTRPGEPNGEFCGPHALMISGHYLGDPRRKEVGFRRSMRAKLNSDRRERGTPAHHYWRERFGDLR